VKAPFDGAIGDTYLSQKGFAIAIDGPGGVGKSTTARRVAEILGMTYIDTGAMYRAVALHNIRSGKDLHNETAVEESLNNLEICFRDQHLFINNEDVTEAVRTQTVSDGASVVASYKAVREKLSYQQKHMANTGQVVMDGRDIGSHVLPQAQVKIYLDADLDTRSARRTEELEAKGLTVDLNKIREETIIRDERDKKRAHSPLVQTADAIYIDNSNLSPDEVVALIVDVARKARKEEINALHCN